MYTKEDIGTNVHSPCGFTYEIGKVFNESTNPLLTFELDEIASLYMDAKGYQVRYDGKRLSRWPVFSRTPYIQGEAFVCVVERPEPKTDWEGHEMHIGILNIFALYDGSLNDSDLTDKICEFLLSGCQCKNSTGQTQFMCCNICGQIDAKVDKELAEDKRKERERACEALISQARHGASCHFISECELRGVGAEYHARDEYRNDHWQEYLTTQARAYLVGEGIITEG